MLPGDLSRFVARHFGARGRAWLERVLELVDSTAAGWGLEIEHALGGGLLSCVLAARTRDSEPVVLKIAGPWVAADREAAALEHWGAGPAPRLLGFDEDSSALLLQRIWPGGTALDESCDRVAQLITALHAAPPTSSQIASLPSLVEVVEERLATAGAEAAARSAAESAALATRLHRARAAARELLSGFAGPSVLLDGDLEQRNVLRCQRRVLAAIDPMPCIGDPPTPPTGPRRDERRSALSKAWPRICGWTPCGCGAGPRSSRWRWRWSSHCVPSTTRSARSSPLPADP